MKTVLSFYFPTVRKQSLWSPEIVYVIYFMIKWVNNLTKTPVVKDLETLAGLQAENESKFHSDILIPVTDNQIQAYRKKSQECDILESRMKVVWKEEFIRNFLGWNINNLSP